MENSMLSDCYWCLKLRSKNRDQKQFGKERVILADRSGSQSITEIRAGATAGVREESCLAASSFGWISDLAQACLPRDDTAHSGLSLLQPLEIKNIPHRYGHRSI